MTIIYIFSICKVPKCQRNNIHAIPLRTPDCGPSACGTCIRHDTSTESRSWLFHCLAHWYWYWYWYVKTAADNSFNNKRHANVSESNNAVPRDPVPDRTLYPSFSLVLTTAPLVPGTAAVSRLRTLNRFTLADVSWSRLRKMGDGVDEDGRRRRRLPSENKGLDVRSAGNTLLLGCAATGSATHCCWGVQELDQQHTVVEVFRDWISNTLLLGCAGIGSATHCCWGVQELDQQHTVVGVCRDWISNTFRWHS